MAEWKMEWNGEYTQLQLTCATGAVVQGCGSCMCQDSELTTEAV